MITVGGVILLVFLAGASALAAFWAVIEARRTRSTMDLLAAELMLDPSMKGRNP